MTYLLHYQQSGENEPFDFNQIFIGREQQLADFERVLRDWRQAMGQSNSEETISIESPSPQNRLQGMVVMLYGRGGFGKSTLLQRYQEIALHENELAQGMMKVWAPINWEYVLNEGKRGLYNPEQGQSIDAAEYFKMLCAMIASRAGRSPKDFRTFQQAASDVEKAKKEASNVLEEMQRDREDRYKELRGASLETVATVISTFVPGSKPIVENTALKKGAEVALQLTGQQIGQLYQRFRHRLGEKLDNYLDPARKLGFALGTDLNNLAKDFPVLIFFDTYEEVDEGDFLLRIVMGAAGPRVGWVIAGRDNLWSGPGQVERSLTLEYGYKEIVSIERGLSVNFNSEDVGAFTLSNIKEYFDQVCEHFPCVPPLAKLSDEDIKRIWKITQGIPLAINIATALYSETGDLDNVTEEIEGQKKIIDGMVRRYLLHTRIDESERAKLYAMAMLRRPDQKPILAIALGLTPDEAKEPNRFDEALRRLHRRYSFIFTEKDEPILHQEVRFYLRLWLRERREQPDILAINERLKTAQETALNKLEDLRNYGSLKDRLQDQQWTAVYLDLTEQQFWLDPVEGIRYLLPLMVAAAIYQRTLNTEARTLGAFFTSCLQAPYQNWWSWAKESLVYLHSSHPSPKERNGLIGLSELLSQSRLMIPPQLNQKEELEAALWWRIGEMYQDDDNLKSLQWYEKALPLLRQEKDLKIAVARTCCTIANKQWEEKKNDESLFFSNKAIEVEPDYHWAYHIRGIVYSDQQHYDLAISNYDNAILLKSDDSDAFYNRGLAYYDQQRYDLAISNYDNAILLKPDDSGAFYNRGLTYLHLKDCERAKADFTKGAEIHPGDVNIAWVLMFTSLGKERLDAQKIEHLEAIADLDPQSNIAALCLAIALGFRGKLKDGLAMLEQVIQQQPEFDDAYFWKGMLSAYYYPNRPQIAMEALEKALACRLPPVLLTPLYWLEKDRPEFFQTFAQPLLERYEI